MPSPIVDVKGPSPFVVVEGMPFNDPGIESKDEDGNLLIPDIDWGGLDPDCPQVGSYVIRYEVRDRLDRIGIGQRRVDVVPAPGPDDSSAASSPSRRPKLHWQHVSQVGIVLVLLVMVTLAVFGGVVGFRHFREAGDRSSSLTVGQIGLSKETSEVLKAAFERGVKFESEGPLRLSFGPASHEPTKKFVGSREPKPKVTTTAPAAVPAATSAPDSPTSLSVKEAMVTVERMEVNYPRGKWRAELTEDENLLLQQLIKRESGKPLEKYDRFAIEGRWFCWNGSRWSVWDCEPNE